MKREVESQTQQGPRRTLWPVTSALPSFSKPSWGRLSGASWGKGRTEGDQGIQGPWLCFKSSPGLGTLLAGGHMADVPPGHQGGWRMARGNLQCSRLQRFSLKPGMTPPDPTQIPHFAPHRASVPCTAQNALAGRGGPTL